MGNKTEGNEHGNSHGHGIHLASWRWDEFGAPFLFILMLLLGVLVKENENKNYCAVRNAGCERSRNT